MIFPYFIQNHICLIDKKIFIISCSNLSLHSPISSNATFPFLIASPRVPYIPSPSISFLGKRRKIHLQEFSKSLPHLSTLGKPPSPEHKYTRGLGECIRSFPACLLLPARRSPSRATSPSRHSLGSIQGRRSSTPPLMYSSSPRRLGFPVARVSVAAA